LVAHKDSIQNIKIVTETLKALAWSEWELTAKFIADGEKTIKLILVSGVRLSMSALRQVLN
jgi:hypothetical protein